MSPVGNSSPFPSTHWDAAITVAPSSVPGGCLNSNPLLAAGRGWPGIDGDFPEVEHMGGLAIQITDLTEVDGEPRVHDLRLARVLGFKRLTDIRGLIERNIEELSQYGGLPHHAVNPGPQGGRPGKDRWLNEEQALIVCMKSDTEGAEAARRDIVTVFTAWRRGEIVPKRQPSVTVQQIGAMFDKKLDPVRQELSHMRRTQDEQGRITEKVLTNVVYLNNRLDDVVKDRRPFPVWVLNEYYHVCQLRYNGECPCCTSKNRAVIIRDGTPISGVQQDDHFNGREKAGVKDGWPVCAECNLKLRDADFKRAAQCRFETFHNYRVAIFGNGTTEPKSAKKAKGTITDRRQSALQM